MTNGIWTTEQAKTGHYFSKSLAKLLLDVFPEGVPIIDYGCGRGDYVEFFGKVGWDATGIEGTEDINEISSLPVMVRDLSQPIDDLHISNSLSLEVGEHIDAEHEDIFLENITKSCDTKLVLSWAVPGQGGWGHVNERSNEYIIDKLKDLGFALNPGQTDFLRRNYDKNEAFWFTNTLMVFDRVVTKVEKEGNSNI